MRRTLTIACEGVALSATLDDAPGSTGLLIVSGGNEIRIGAHRGMAKLAAAVAGRGWPVLRFDRRGIGDSEGVNRGYASSGPDIAAATSALRQAGAKQIVALGNCDAATALAVHRADAAIDALVLTNPWIVKPVDDLPSSAAIKGHYADRLRDPAAWKNLAKGRIDLSALARGVGKLLKPEPPQSLAATFADAVADHPLPTTIVLAERDGTARGFADAWKSSPFDRVRHRVSVETIDTGSHSFAGDGDFEALLRIVTQVLERLRPPLPATPQTRLRPGSVRRRARPCTPSPPR